MEEKLEAYIRHLKQEERRPATYTMYEREIRRFLRFAGSRPLSKELVIEYKEKLQSSYQTASVNVKLAALNGFFRFAGKEEWRVRQLKVQKNAYCPRERELTKAEYRHLVELAGKKGDERLALLLETICGTGIRVSELPFITVEAAARGEAVVRMKGKIRVVFLTEKLCSLLKGYAHRRKIGSGPVFVTRSGRPLDRSNIWKMMKQLGKRAGLRSEKIFPHNLRHLFARTFYALERDLVRLADVLGHSNINTTRIYTISSGQEHRRLMNAMRLVI